MNANRQELDYLLNPELWDSSYVIDAKYKPRYKRRILRKKTQEKSRYVRLSEVYKLLGLDEETSLPMKCLIVYPFKSEKSIFRSIV